MEGFLKTTKLHPHLMTSKGVLTENFDENGKQNNNLNLIGNTARNLVM